MKSIKTISKKFAKLMDKPQINISDDTSPLGHTIYYCTVSGYFNGNYYYVYFTYSKRSDIYRINISDNTICPLNILTIIKNIEPKIKVTYYEVMYKKITR